MKKIALIFVFICGLSRMAGAQTLEVNMDEGYCLTAFTAVFTDESEQQLDLGCGGTYYFTIGSLVLHHIVVNGVYCTMNAETDVVLDHAQKARVGTKPSKISFGGGTTR